MAGGEKAPDTPDESGLKSRIKELRYVRASELQRNPDNWRIHPENQETQMRNLLRRIGYANALVCAESPDGLVLLDGHLRANISGDEKVPVLITDLDPDEQAVVLATADGIGRLAEWDETSLDSLLKRVEGLADQRLAGLAEITRNQMPDVSLWDAETADDDNVDPQNVPLTKRIVIHCPAEKGEEVVDKIAQALDGMEDVTIA